MTAQEPDPLHALYETDVQTPGGRLDPAAGDGAADVGRDMDGDVDLDRDGALDDAAPAGAPAAPRPAGCPEPTGPLCAAGFEAIVSSAAFW
jgi:hypothetical protein